MYKLYAFFLVIDKTNISVIFYQQVPVLYNMNGEIRVYY